MILLVVYGCLLFEPVLAATTTKRPPTLALKCSAGDCALHDGRLRQFQSTAMAEDFLSVLSDSAISAFISTSKVELGDVFFRCGRLFYRSQFQGSFGDAVLTCAKRKMQLVTVEEGELNMRCLVPDLSQMKLEQQQHQKYFFIWTSGMAEGKKCANAAYSWCAGNKTRITASSLGLPAQVSPTERCLALSMMSKTLVRMKCNELNYFFCEYKCKTVNCIREDICRVTNRTYFDQSGKLKRLMLGGVWAVWQQRQWNGVSRDTAFLFGHKKVTWTENIRLCCSIGMKPVRVTDLLLDTLTSEGNQSSRIFVQAPYGMTAGGRELVKTSFWTAATRQGCAGQYRFCQHDDQGPWDSQDNFWQMVNPRDVGSCLVVDRQYAKSGTPFGVRQVQCSRPSANFACQKDGKNIADLVNDDKMTAAQGEERACNLPLCPNAMYCDMNLDASSGNFYLQIQYSLKYASERVLLKPYLLGEWKTACGVRFLTTTREMSWKESFDYCCRLGMRLLTVQSVEKLSCLSEILEANTDEDGGYSDLTFWTSGINNGCENQRYRWCSSEVKDFVKPSVNLRNETINFISLSNVFYQPVEPSEYCVIVKNSKKEGPILGIDTCDTNRKAICEARVMDDSHLQEVFNECKLTHRVTKRDIEKFNSTEVKSFSYKMKCFATCIAELLGFLYEGGKFWTDTVERELVKVKVAGAASQEFAAIMSKYSVNFFKKATDNMNALNMLIVEQMKEDAWKSTLLVNEAQDKFWECNELVKFDSSHDECHFIHDFLKCFTNNSDSLTKFWNRDLQNVAQRTDYAALVGKPLSELQGQDPRNFTEVVDPISYTEEIISSRCTIRHLRAKNLTLNQSCYEIYSNFEPTEIENVLLVKPVFGQLYSHADAAAMCHRANGSLPTYESQQDMRVLISIVENNFTRYVSTSAYDEFYRSRMEMPLDEVYKDSAGVLRWCSTSGTVTTACNALSKTDEPSLGYAIEDEYRKLKCESHDLKDLVPLPLIFCSFDKTQLSMCKQINNGTL
ncbi:uncharacterized protein LOC135942233 [Cloeon dipterum]|uniref:uncharacterized protein LOC135942233 n=1 Tax=Cloeon dipterum TaxID=197152 RepID=UPI003220941A